MINTNDYLLIFRNGHIRYCGQARTIRGFDQKTIQVIAFSDGRHTAFDVNRETGLAEHDGEYLHAKVIPKDVWQNTVKQRQLEYEYNSFQKQEKERRYWEELENLGQEAETWYSSLPERERKLIDALVYKWRPIAIA